MKIIFFPLFNFRGLKFLKGFLTEVKNGEKDIQTALSKCASYSDRSAIRLEIATLEMGQSIWRHFYFEFIFFSF